MLSVRPKIAELVFHVYGRSLHPELFEVHHTRRIERGGYTAVVQITSAGHLISWEYGNTRLTEVAASAQHPLPERRRIMSHALKGQCIDRLELECGITYEVEFSLEPVERKAFWTYQKELTQAGTRQGMLHCFDSSGRFGLGAMSYIHLQSRDRSLRVQAFHTFPDDYAIVRTQSTFLLPEK